MPYLILNFAREHANMNEETGECDWMLIDDLSSNGINCTGNGCVVRAGSSLDRVYNVEKRRVNDKCFSSPIKAIRFAGYKEGDTFKQTIRGDIKRELSQKKSAWSGMPGTPTDPIEVDHKNGLKDEMRLNDLSQQHLEDFQPLKKSENDLKRQYCKVCERTLTRPSAKEILGEAECFDIEFTHGDSHLDSSLGCKGCFLYDPIQWRKDALQMCIKKNLSI